MTLSIKDAAGASQNLATGSGDGGATPFVSPTATAVGAQADPAATTDTGTFSLLAFVKRALQNWTTLLGRVPVKGQAAMSASLPVAIASDQSGLPVTGTFWQATQPVSLASLPALPANQSVNVAQVGGAAFALGQALATASVPVVLTAAQLTTLTPPGTVTANIGTSGSLALDASVTGLQVAQGSTTSGQSGPLAQGAVTTAAPTYTTGKTNPLSLTTAGALRVDASATTQPVSGTVTVGNATLAVTQSGTWNVGTVTTLTTCSTVTSLTQFNGVAITLNKGSSDAGTLRVSLGDGSQTIGALTANQSVNLAQVAGATTATGHGTASGAVRVELPTDGTGVLAGVTTVTTVSAVTAITNALPAGTNNIGQVCLAPQTSGGLSTYSVISSGAANQDSAAVKGSAGQVYGYSLFNTTASARYVKLYNKASGATSADTPVRRIYLPPTGGVDRSEPNGIAFGTGICIRITTGAADSDTGACSANDVLANIDYK